MTATYSPGRYIAPRRRRAGANIDPRTANGRCGGTRLGAVRATKWRDGLPRPAHTLAKAASSGSGYLDSEIDLLNAHLQAITSRVLGEYPDNHDPATVGNWQLLASIGALINNERICANYHLAWFQAMSLTPTGRHSDDRWTTERQRRPVPAGEWPERAAPLITSDPLVTGATPIEQLLRVLGLAANAGDPTDNSESVDGHAERDLKTAEAAAKFPAQDEEAATEMAGIAGPGDSAQMAQQLPQMASGIAGALAGAIGGALQPLAQIPSRSPRGQQAMQTGMGLVQQAGGSADQLDDASLPTSRSTNMAWGQQVWTQAAAGR